MPSVAAVVREALDEFAGISGKLPQSLRRLVWPPGELTREWKRGRRARFVSPVRLYLALAVVFFLAWPHTGFAEGLEGFTSGFLGAGTDAPTGAPDAVQLGEEVVTSWLPAILIVVLVPFFATALHLLNGRRAAFVSDVVAALHLHSVFFLVVASTAPFRILLGVESTGTSEAILLLSLFLFLCISIARVYRITAWRAVVRSLVLVSAYSVLATAAISVVLGLVASSVLLGQFVGSGAVR